MDDLSNQEGKNRFEEVNELVQQVQDVGSLLLTQVANRTELAISTYDVKDTKKESFLTSGSANLRRKYIKKKLANNYFDKFENEYKNFVNVYKQVITQDEIHQIISRKKMQTIKTSSQLLDEVKAVFNFLYRHFQIVLPKSDIKKIFTSSFAQEETCNTFYGSSLQEDVKNLYSNFKKRLRKVESELFELRDNDVKLLPSKFDLSPFKRVLVMNNQMDSYFKKVIYNDEKNFALVMYSNFKVEKIKRVGFEHVFIDGTKSYIPYKQNYQLIMINLLLKNDQTATGISALVKGSNQQIYESLLTYACTILDLRDKHIHTDFERALLNASSKISSKINLCYFHYSRNLQDKVRDLQRTHKKKRISKRLYEYGKILMFVPPQYVDFHRKYMTHLAGKSKNNKRFLNYLDSTYIDKRYRDVLYQKHSKFLTNNIAESVNGQMSNHFKMKPKKYEWLDFMLFNEKRVVQSSQKVNEKTGEYDLDDFDNFIIKLQRRKKFSYQTYRRFMRTYQMPKGVKKNMKKDRRYFRRPLS